MRLLALVLFIAACKPSATIRSSTKIASLQSYGSVSLRVRSQGFATQGVAMIMEQAVVNHLRQRCSFVPIDPRTGAPADVILDLTITNYTRGGSWGNTNQVTLDTLLVLSDGSDKELLGTASINGKSSGSLVDNRPQDNEAISIVAKTIGDILWKSGCAGPRVAKAAPPPDTGTGTGTGTGNAAPDETKRADAEALNEKGKEALFNADTNNALTYFQQANAMLPDAKYQFNICLALGAAQRYPEATTACKQARAMNPSPKLAAKIDQRLEGLAQGQ